MGSCPFLGLYDFSACLAVSSVSTLYLMGLQEPPSLDQMGVTTPDPTRIILALFTGELWKFSLLDL